MRNQTLIVCLLAACTLQAGDPTWQSVRSEAVRLFKLGRYSEAKELAKDALRAGAGRSDLDTGMLAWTLACAHHALGETEDAGWHYQMAVRALERAGGDASPYLARVLADWALMLELKGRVREAERARRQALEILSSRLGPSHLETLAVRGELAIGHFSRGDFKRAEQACREVIQARAEANAPADVRLGMVWVALGSSLMRAGSYAEAAEAFGWSAALVEKLLGPGHPKLADALIGQASAYVEMRRFDAAEGLLRRADGVVETSLPPEHPVRLSVMLLRYEVLRATGRGKEARAFERNHRAGLHAARSIGSTVSWSELLRARD